MAGDKEKIKDCMKEGIIRKKEGFFSLKDVPVRNSREDQFGSKKYSDGLATYVRFCDTPMTIALQGGWGSGKTSLMQMLEEEVSKDKNVHTIWFNTWQYSQFGAGDNLTVNFLECLVRKIMTINPERDAGDEERHRIITKVKMLNLLKVSTAALWTAASDLIPSNVINSINAGAEMAATIMNEQERAAERLEISDVLTTLKEDLQKWLNKKIVTKGRDDEDDARMVIFVDDLDRLEPVKAIELLEILKLFMDLERCVYVLAIDYEVVVRGIKEKYGHDFSEEKGRAFFDKIIQLPFQMPIDKYNIDEYITKLFNMLPITVQNQENALGFIKNATGGNPRALKRLFNALSLRMIIEKDDKSQKDEKQDDMILGSLCLQFCSERLSSFISSIDIQEDTLKKLANSSYEDLMREDIYKKALKSSGISSADFWEENRGCFSDFNELLGEIEAADLSRFKTVLSDSAIISHGRGYRRPETEFEPEARVFNAADDTKKIKELNDGIGLDQCRFESFTLGDGKTYSDFNTGSGFLKKAMSKIYEMAPDSFDHMVKNKDELNAGLLTFFYGNNEKSQKAVIDGTNYKIDLKNGSERKIELIKQVMEKMGLDPSKFQYYVRLKQFKI